MEKETVRVSIKPIRLIVIFLIAIGVVAAVFWFRANPKKTPANGNAKELILPRDTGVADSGFEGSIGNFETLNAKAEIDKRVKIEGASSLKIFFSDQLIASIKIKNYFNNIQEGGFYRLGFWSMGDVEEDRRMTVYIAEKEKIQELGSFTLKKGDDASYFDFIFQANGNADDFILTSTDALEGNAWIDLATVEELNVDSVEELNNLKSIIFGNTSWKNIDQAFSGEDSGSGDFLSRPERKIGQIFQPARELFSGVALKIFRHGDGGSGMYQLQIREFDDTLGLISDEASASMYVDFSLRPELAEKAKTEEQQMREDFIRNEQGIKNGKVSNDETVDRYPDSFTQDQIDADKAKKRAVKLEVDIKDMKESFNIIEEIDIPLAAKLDVNKKYWIGIDNRSVAVDQNNYISIVAAKADKEGDNNSAGGYISEVPGVWKNFEALWLKTFYPVHSEINGKQILSGATIADLGKGKLVYRYQFEDGDHNAASGFSGRKIYDMNSGVYANPDLLGNYKFSDNEQYATYKFDTFYPIEKIILRNVRYHQSLAIDFSNNEENWEEIFSDNPAEDHQVSDPIVFSPKDKSDLFYLRMRSAGNSSTPLELNLEAELSSQL